MRNMFRMGGLGSLKTLSTLIGVAAVGFVLAGCESLGPLGGGGNNAPTATASFTVVSIIGAPDTVKPALTAELTTSAQARGLTIVSGPANPQGRNLTGYLSAITESNGTAFSYVWDVFDAGGNRVHRVEGKALASERPSDPWIAAKQPVLKNIADSSMASLATWLQANAPAAASAPAATSNQPASAAPRTNSGSLPPPSTLSTPPGQSSGLRPSVIDPATPNVQTASARPAIQPISFQRFSRQRQQQGPVTYLLYGSVTGASGDGNQALSKAMQNALQPYQISLVSALPRRATGTNAKILSAEVTNSAFDNENDAVAVIWQLENASGEVLGTVRQFRKVKKESLARNWGTHADKAAASAAPEIASLLAE